MKKNDEFWIEVGAWSIVALAILGIFIVLYGG